VVTLASLFTCEFDGTSSKCFVHWEYCMCNSSTTAEGSSWQHEKMQKKRILLSPFISSLLGLSYEAVETDELWGS